MSAPEPHGDVGLYKRIPAPELREADHSSPLHRFWYWFIGRERVPEASHTGLIEDPPEAGEKAKIGICCSGGGIRSAAFNLGALQVLQAKGRLQEARYLAAVSGGSYIAAAFAMVAKTRAPEDPDGDDSDPDLVDESRPPFYCGSPEEQYLRNRSSYMAPGGLGRARFVLRVAVGLLVNLAVLTLALVLVAWLLALYYRFVHGHLQDPANHAAADTHPLELLTVGVLVFAAILFGAGSDLFPPKREERRREIETATIRGLQLAVLVLLVAVAIPELLAWLRNSGDNGQSSPLTDSATRDGVSAAVGGSFAALLSAVLLGLRARPSVADAKRALKDTTERVAWYRKLAPRLRATVMQIGAWCVGPLLLGSILVLALLAMVSASHINPVVIVAVMVAFAFACSRDVTAWSLHPFYRRRLCTAFALKRVQRPDAPAGDAGIAKERDYDRLVPLSKSGVRPGPGPGPDKEWPTLVVCAAANVSDPAATPPGREVTSFTFSPAAMGGPLIGGVQTSVFEERLSERRQRDFTLAAAVAMSGAAVSPSMGKETKPSVRFLLALANVRLGVWVPNPRHARRLVLVAPEPTDRLHQRVCDHLRDPVETSLPGELPEDGRHLSRRLTAPRPGPWYLLKEMLGWNSVNDAFLYVTDGGHYENLGLVELLRRGCTEIYCFDASGGASLKSLGDAIAIARSELNVEIDELDVTSLEENDDRLAEQCCVTGTIRYPRDPQTGRQPTGTLIYARSVVTEKAPYDVQAFRIRDKDFPHHSTLDQLYTDEKFEAYRALGAHCGRAALEATAPPASQPPARRRLREAPWLEKSHRILVGRGFVLAEAHRRRSRDA